MRYCILLILCLSFFSCKNKNLEKRAQTSFWEVSDSLDVEIGTPMLMQLSDNLLFVDRSFSAPYMIDAIDIRKNKLLYSFAKKGQGPNEFIQITNIDVFQSNNHRYIQLFDNIQRKISVYSIDSLNHSLGKCLPIIEKKLDENTRYLEIYRINDSSYIATGRTKQKFTFMDEKLDKVISCGNYLQENNTNVDSMTRSKANYGRLYLSPNRTQLASVVFMAGVMELYNINDDTIQKKWDYSLHSLKYNIQEKSLLPLNPMGYLAAGFVNNYLIGLYSGEEKKGGTSYGNEFHIFDHNGNIKRKYLLSSKILNFCIDKNTNSIYAISYREDPKILIYKIDEQIK
ncbi:BF3164 family lipoprotein [Parabacteroides chinchillae]|uniref:TolB-like 6-blade propeller-like n=1 Tax=Parabacteroides chinchillae TaxID=871327 RepID=A0A8G2F2P7_9BACT|nr:BF3164 family lipoprotein [Parabacteroides chinchillae]SEG29294.1 TolB-like 6-blade propeller-like [Parabacteroides chinchillae]